MEAAEVRRRKTMCGFESHAYGCHYKKTSFCSCCIRVLRRNWEAVLVSEIIGIVDRWNTFCRLSEKTNLLTFCCKANCCNMLPNF